MDNTLSQQLAPLRDEIDAVDAKLLELVNQRARLAQRVGEVKHAAGGVDTVVLRPEREAQVVRRLQALNGGPLPADSVRAIWSEVISACRGLERGLSVAYLGPEGTYSEMAALAHFGHAIQARPYPSIDAVFRAVETGDTDMGIVPVENSTEGAVNRTLDLFLASPVKISGEHSLKIHQCLMTQSGTLEGVTRVLAHPQSLAQCHGWLNQHCAELGREAISSNAEAARQASLDPTVAAIAGEPAARKWGLQLVAAGIQDDPHNRTRFVAIGHDETPPSGHDITSLILAVPNRAGAVYEMLQPLAENGVSMNRFESRPARTGQWEYYFYTDLVGHRNDPPVARALEALQSRAAYFKVLGSYPAQP